MSLPSASTRLSDQSAAAPVSTDLIAVFGACASNADSVPRLYSNVAALIAMHGYCESAEYAALHMQDAAKPILFVPLPISTAGTIGRFNSSGNTGTCVVTCAGAAGGILAETDGVLLVTNGGTVGTDQIMLSLSLDGGTTYKPVRLGTNLTFTVPNVGLVLSFAAGTLVAGDTALTWHSVAPLADYTSLTAAFNAMYAQKRVTRSWLFVGDISTLVAAQGIEANVNAYETTCERYTYAKAQLRDRLPCASLSQVHAAMTSASLTFAEVGVTGDTITRAAGSFITDGFIVGDTIRVTGSASNNVTGAVTGVTATVLTLGTTDLAAEGPVTNVAITSEPTLTFSATGHTITRSRGSWLDDGFRVGDSITVTGSASNNYTKTLTAVTATVLTFAAGGVDETIGAVGVTIVTGETDTAWVASIAALVANVSTSKRVDLGAGRLRKLSPITGYSMRRPVQWADSIRSYEHDIRTTTWWKDLGPLDGWSIDGEHDERVSAGLLDNRFTCARTWGNGPDGAFIAQSLTRATDGSILGMTHNVAISSLAQTVCQTVTEGFAGMVLVLKPADANGKRVATPKSIAILEAKVNSELQRNLLSNVGGEGQRASVATWTAATDDDLGVANATLHGTLDLQLNGTLVHISTTVGVR
jgi:hypothetical protein